MQRPVCRGHPVAVAEHPVAADLVGLLEAVERNPSLVQGLRGRDSRGAGADHAYGGQRSHRAMRTKDDGAVRFEICHTAAAGLTPTRRRPVRAPAASPARCSLPRWITSRKLLKRKISISAANPSAALSTAVAICWPTENDGHVGGCAGEDRQQQRLLHARRPRGEREHRRDDLHGQHQQRVADRAADVERVEQRPVGAQPEEPAGELPAAHLAQVAARSRRIVKPWRTRAQNARTVADSSANATTKRSPARSAKNSVNRGCAGEEAEVERRQLGEVGRLGEDALREREAASPATP